MRKENASMKKLSLFKRCLVLLFISSLGAGSWVSQSEATPVKALPAPTGPKKTIGVSTFENKAGGWAQWDLGNGMAEMLTTALIASGRFTVVERPEIQKVITEQDFGASGRTAGGEAAQFGKILKAQIMISGAVTEFEANGGGQGGGFSVKGFTIGGNRASAKVGVNIRLYDTTTGQILDSQHCEGLAEEGGLSFSYSDSNFGMGGSSFNKTPLGRACQDAINKAVFFIVARMQNVPWYGRIVDVKEDGKVFINAGINAGMAPGDVLSVFRAGEALVDPETGLDLGSELTKIGQVQILQTQDKFSVATTTAGGGFQRGDTLKFEG
jgi:curli biogenesis system outer membrane secretion channel CsgG